MSVLSPVTCLPNFRVCRIRHFNDVVHWSDWQVCCALTRRDTYWTKSSSPTFTLFTWWRIR